VSGGPFWASRTNDEPKKGRLPGGKKCPQRRSDFAGEGTAQEVCTSRGTKSFRTGVHRSDKKAVKQQMVFVKRCVGILKKSGGGANRHGAGDTCRESDGNTRREILNRTQRGMPPENFAAKKYLEIDCSGSFLGC